MSLSLEEVCQDLSLSVEEIIQVLNFFDKNINLSVQFVQLFELQVSLCPYEIIFDNRETIIGFRCNNEHLRVYFRKEGKSFFVKFKALDRTLLFKENNLEEYEALLEENNHEFEDNLDSYLLYGSTPQKKKSKSTRKASLKQKTVEEKDKVLSKLCNRANAKRFTVKYFNDIEDWSFCSSPTENRKIRKILPNGNIIECESKSEEKFLDYLLNKNLTLGIGAQNLEIFYDTSFRSSASYHPDFVILTKDNHIAIVEIKPASSMSYHINISKYEALKEYCENHSYEYMMVDPDNDYMSFEDMKKLDIPSDIYNRVMHYLRSLLEEKYKNYCLLDTSDISKLYQEFETQYKKKDFLLFLHALVIQEGWYNKRRHDFNVYKNPER